MITSPNKQLYNLYNSHWDLLSKHLTFIVNDNNYQIKPCNPLLISINNESYFLNSDIRVMVFGQENNDWEGVFSNNPDHLLNVYSDFAPINAPMQYKNIFGTHYNYFQSLMQEVFPDKKISWIYNNIVKISMLSETGTPPDYILNIEKQYFSVISNEVDILKPHFILFYTGSKYDSLIRTYFPKNTMIPFNSNKFPNVFLLKYNEIIAFRLDHPRRLNILSEPVYTDLYKHIISVFSNSLIH